MRREKSRLRFFLHLFTSVIGDTYCPFNGLRSYPDKYIIHAIYWFYTALLLYCTYILS